MRNHYFHSIPSRNKYAESVKLALGSTVLANPVGIWIDEDLPERENSFGLLAQGELGYSWIEGTNTFLLEEQRGPQTGQIAHLDIDAGKKSILTNSPGQRGFPLLGMRRNSVVKYSWLFRCQERE